MMSDDGEKALVSHTILVSSKQYLHNTKRDDPTESTDVVLAEYPSKVKLELYITLECQSQDELSIS